VKIPIKMTIALTAAGLTLFGSYGLYLMRAERWELRQAVERELGLVGRSLQVAIENALRDRQLDDVREVVQTLAVAEGSVDVVVLDGAGRVIVAPGRSASIGVRQQQIAMRAIETRENILRYVPPGGLDELLLAMPLLADDGSISGGLVVVRPLADLRQDLRRTQRAITLSVALFVLTNSALGLFLGTAYIGRPLARMVAAMRRVRGGDLTSMLAVLRQDEVGELAREFNAMVAELKETRSRLQAETDSRRQLQHSLQEADKLITIGQLSAGLAHEIGSPLQILHGRARALVARAHDAEETRRNGEILVEQSERIAGIVEQLLRFARRRPAHIDAADVRAAVRAVIELLDFEARRRGIELRFDCPAELPQIRADADRLQQVVLNLVTNALNATPKGGRVSIEIEPGRMRGTEDGNPTPSLRLIVRDTGLGISDSVRRRLFEPFFTTRGAEGGSGLGLAVVKAIVNDHGGSVWADSQPGQGACFTVELPVAGPAAS
jgi:signal transduction histidine kinase